ncbi:MAG: hypothetical protein L0226_13795 [Acidobacteria bacterium]|nr:hypothetical protein [Acidobacteriota bacterium]
MLMESSYEIVKNLIPSRTCEQILEGVNLFQQRDWLNYSDNIVKKAYAAYANPMTEVLLQNLCPTIENIVGHPLYPTFSYLRVYLKGADLKKHVDRESCEISVTLTIQTGGAHIWPVFLDVSGRIVRVELEPGDGLIYKGCEIPHWRDTFGGERQVQIFLHYVRQNGPYSEYKFDRRARLAIPALWEFAGD